MNKDKSIRLKKENKKEGVVGEKWDITWEGVDRKTKMVCDKTKELKIFPTFQVHFVSFLLHTR